MATIQGPKFQFSVSEIFDFEYDQAGRITGVVMKQSFATFLNSIQQTAYALTRSGPTASRPTSTLPGRWIGMPYYDTTVGGPVFLSTTQPDVWITASTWVVA